MQRIEPGPGQESVWDYPRPPALTHDRRLVEVSFGGSSVAASRQAIRVLETSHPPTFYVPFEDIDFDRLVGATGTSVCEWKGVARYWDVVADGARAERAAWSYPDPAPAFAAIAEHVAFYPSKVECRVDGIGVRAQEGDFYGGWITPDIVGPFKGGAGTWGW